MTERKLQGKTGPLYEALKNADPDVFARVAQIARESAALRARDLILDSWSRQVRRYQ